MSQHNDVIPSPGTDYEVGLWVERKLGKPAVEINLAEKLTLRVAVSKKPLEIRTLSTFVALEIFRTVWQSWPGTLASDIDYFCAMLQARSPECKPHVIVLSRNGEPEAMLVGFRQRQRVPAKIGTRVICNTEADVLEFVAGSLRGNASEENCEALVREVMRILDESEVDLATWDDLDTESPLCKHALRLPHPWLADHLNWQVDRWLMKFPAGLDAFLMSLERSQRSKLRRKYKKVLSHFDQRMEIRIVNSPADLENAFPQFEQIAAKTEKRKQGFGFFDTADIRQELRQAAEKGWLRAFIVFLEGQPAAFWIGTLYNRSLQAEYVGFDPVWSEFSPGIFLFLSLLNMLDGEDIATIDFGRGDTQLRQCFSDIKRVEARVRIYSPSLRGLWLNLVRTVAFTSTSMLRQTSGFSFGEALKSYFREDGGSRGNLPYPNSSAETQLLSAEPEHASTPL